LLRVRLWQQCHGIRPWNHINLIEGILRQPGKDSGVKTAGVDLSEQVSAEHPSAILQLHWCRPMLFVCVGCDHCIMAGLTKHQRKPHGIGHT